LRIKAGKNWGKVDNYRSFKRNAAKEITYLSKDAGRSREK